MKDGTVIRCKFGNHVSIWAVSDELRVRRRHREGVGRPIAKPWCPSTRRPVAKSSSSRCPKLGESTPASGDRWLSEVSRHREKQTRLWLQRQPLVGRTGDRTLVCKIRNGTRCVFLWESCCFFRLDHISCCRLGPCRPVFISQRPVFPRVSFDVISLLFLKVPAVNSRVALFATKVSSSCEAFSASLAASLLPLVVQVVPRFRRRMRFLTVLSVSFAWQLGRRIGLPREAVVGASLNGQVQRCNGRRHFSGFATNVHEIRTARNDHEFCSTAQHGRRSSETHGTGFHALTALSQQSQTANRGQGLSFTHVAVRPSAGSCVWREVPKRARCYGHQSCVTQRSVPGTMLLEKETSCTLHRRSRWTVIGSIFINSVSNGRRKRLGKRIDKSHKFKQSTWGLPLRMSAP